MTLVVPVRMATHDRVIQTTSRELTDSSVKLATQQRPRALELMAVRLYLPDAQLPAGVMGRVRPEQPEQGELWLDLLDTAGSTGERIRALSSRLGPHRAGVRYPVSVAASIERGGERIAARATDVSSGGAFLRCESDLEPGALLTMQLLMSDHDDPLEVGARVVHRIRAGERQAPWTEPGVGVQFIDGDDEFRARIDRFLRKLRAA
ncbi:MAG TPA: PilZ domain-containing protein [Myxococcales bacterium]|nr:PilZ domain-containing protein [Myxococcales bacterium]